jgi:hypothetical protein
MRGIEVREVRRASARQFVAEGDVVQSGGVKPAVLVFV